MYMKKNIGTLSFRKKWVVQGFEQGPNDSDARSIPTKLYLLVIEVCYIAQLVESLRHNLMSPGSNP